MAESRLPEKGSRVRIVGIMRDEPDPLALGEEGTVTHATQAAGGQIFVAWDSGRTLILLPEDPFVVVSRG